MRLQVEGECIGTVANVRRRFLSLYYAQNYLFYDIAHSSVSYAASCVPALPAVAALLRLPNAGQRVERRGKLSVQAPNRPTPPTPTALLCPTQSDKDEKEIVRTEV